MNKPNVDVFLVVIASLLPYLWNCLWQLQEVT